MSEVKSTTLCLVVDTQNKKILMIHKKRGQGAGKWNFPGGKVSLGETSLEGAIRETIEETGITPRGLILVGHLVFLFQKTGTDSWNNECEVFLAGDFFGELISETEECSATWVSLDKIPYEKMWETDREWLPLALTKTEFSMEYLFDENNRILKGKRKA